MNDVKLITLTDTELEEIITRSVANGVRQVISKKKNERYISPNQACKILGISIQALNSRRKRGELQDFKLKGKTYFYSESEIMNY